MVKVRLIKGSFDIKVYVFTLLFKETALPAEHLGGCGVPAPGHSWSRDPEGN